MRTPGKFAAVKKKKKRRKEKEKKRRKVSTSLCTLHTLVERGCWFIGEQRFEWNWLELVRASIDDHRRASSLTGLRSSLKSFPFPAIAPNAMPRL